MKGYKDDHMKFSFMDAHKKVAAPSLESWLTSLQLEELEVPLRKLGASTLADLIDLDDDELRGLDLNVLQKKHWYLY